MSELSASTNLLRELEVSVEKLRHAGVVEDDSPALVPFLSVLEKILRNGLTAKSNFLGYERRDYWNWMESLQKNNALHYELTHAKNLLEAKTPQGKGRAFIRFALAEKSLADAVQLLLVDQSLKEEFYSNRAFLCNEFCANALITLLYEVNSFTFNLTKTNVDLDNSWTATRAEGGKKDAKGAGPTPVAVITPALVPSPSPSPSPAKSKKDLEQEEDDEKAALASTVTALEHKLRSVEKKRDAAEKAWATLKSELLERIAALQDTVKSLETRVGEIEGTPRPSSVIPGDLAQRLDQLVLELDAEKARNVLVESTELREKQLYYEHLLAQAGSGAPSAETSAAHAAEIAKRDEEISRLESELKHRRDWILQTELSRNDQQAAEKQRAQDLFDAKKQLDAERKKLASLQTIVADLEKGMAQKEAQVVEDATQVQDLRNRLEAYEDRFEKFEKDNEQLKDELNAESAARRMIEESARNMEEELQRLSAKYEKDTLKYTELVQNERKEKTEFVGETQKLLMDFQREIEDEKLRRLQILKQLESERARITMQKWTKDQDTSSCLSCKQEFTLFRRRHHCRSCGRIYCHSCSSRTALTTAGPNPVRVCDDCFNKLSTDQQAASLLTSLGADLTKGLESFLSSPTTANAPGTPTSVTSMASVPIATQQGQMPQPKLSRFGSAPRFGTPPRGSALARQGTPPPVNTLK